MKTLYLDCSMGAAGDMLMAALLELFPEPEKIIAQMNMLGIPSVHFKAEPSVKCGIKGTHVSVTVDGREEGKNEESGHANHHCHTSMEEIKNLISNLNLPDTVHSDTLAIYQSIALAESKVHGVPVSEIHFHEVGTMDAVADIVGVSLLFRKLAPENVLASPVCVGSGQVRCAHGILPVPAPATALLLKGMPVYAGTVSGELCTPTGAALLKYFVKKFTPMPVMEIGSIGYGMGNRDYDAANCVRAFLGEAGEQNNRITELCCNLHDMTPEEVAFAEERLFAGGALDVWITAIQMKKSRPGVLLSCLCREEQREELLRPFFRYTTTIGVRWTEWNRRELERSERTVSTPDGFLHIKSVSGSGIHREKAEYDDLAEIARKRGTSLAEARQWIAEKE